MDPINDVTSSEPKSLNTPIEGHSEKSDTQSKQINITQEFLSISEENSFRSNNSETQKRKCRQHSNEHLKKKKCVINQPDSNFKGKLETLSDDSMSEEEKEVFSLLVSKLPFQWTCDQITDFIKEHCVDAYALEQLEGGDLDSGQTIRLLFFNFEKCNQARKQLKLKSVDGHKLSVSFGVPEDSDSEAETEKTLLLVKRDSKHSFSSPWRPDLDIWVPDSTGMYGLKPEYLDSLGITPPIDKWVHVSNFRCDKSELKEVLELAGQVVICTVISVTNKYAKVMYGHPLEAVQAVSMLNGQIFYGQVLKVSMYKCPNNEMILPKGLMNVGSGLGAQGKPLRDIVKHYERYLSGKSSSIDNTIFMETYDNASGIRYTPNSATESMDNLMSIDTNLNSDIQTNNEREDISQQLVPNQQGNGSVQTLAALNTVNSTQRSQQQGFQNATVTAGPSSATMHSGKFNGASPTISISQPFTNNPITNLSGNNIHKSSPVGPSTGYPQFNGPIPGSNASLRGTVPRFSGPASTNFPVNNPRISGPVPRPSGPRFINPNSGMAPRVPGPNVCQSGSNNWGNNTGPNLNDTVAPAQIPIAIRPVCGPQQLNKGNSSIVELSNLPLSTTFPILSAKLADVGQVMSVELTRAGCAVVRFANPTHALRCYQHFNKMCVMGNFIEVKFI